MTFSDMVTQSVLTRLLATIILALIMIAAIIVATVDLVTGRALPDIVQAILWTGLGTAGAILGINFGVVLQPMAGPKIPTAPPAPGGTNVTTP